MKPILSYFVDYLLELEEKKVIGTWKIETSSEKPQN